MKKKAGIGFRYALKGIVSFFWKERNARIHLVAAMGIVVAGFFFSLTATEWLWISLAIALVFITEMLNSAIELLCDLVMPEFHEKAGRLKDIAAGAVLVAALFALIVAGMVFIPRFWS